MTDFFRNKLADNYRLAVSGLFNVPAADTYDIIRIPQWGFVYDAYFEVITACTATATITVGFKGNGESATADYFFTNTETAPTVEGIKTPVSTGFGKYFSAASGTITVTVAGTALVAGLFRVFIGYSMIQ